VQGCVSLHDAKPCVPELDWHDHSIPTLLVLEDLARGGWVRGAPPLEHTLASPRQFDVRDPLARRAYLRCLIGLPDLILGGNMASLRSDQIELYYACVLASKQPNDVPVDKDKIVYGILLARAAVGLPHAALQDHEHESSAGSCSSSDGPIVVARSGDRAKRRQQGSRVGQRKRVRVAEWHSLVGLSARPAEVPLPIGDVAVGADQPVAASGAASSCEQALVPAAAPAPAENAIAVAAGAEQAHAARSLLEGAEVYEEAHGVLGQPRSYRRLCVKCPHHRGQRRGCGKTRTFSERLGQESGLHDLEPYAFLGAWLSAHSRFEDVAAHKKYTPTVADVQSYVKDRQWLSA